MKFFGYTTPIAIQWFWKNMYNPYEWSVWTVGYKFTDESPGTRDMIWDFLIRVSNSNKNIFGGMKKDPDRFFCVFIVRGQDIRSYFALAPHRERFNITRFSVSSGKDKRFVDDMIAWDNVYKTEIAGCDGFLSFYDVADLLELAVNSYTEENPPDFWVPDIDPFSYDCECCGMHLACESWATFVWTHYFGKSTAGGSKL